MPLPLFVRQDPYYPLAPGCIWIYRDVTRGALIRTAVRTVETAPEGHWRVAIDTLFTHKGVLAEERLHVRGDGVYVQHRGRWQGPDPVLPLDPGRHWVIGADSPYPVLSTVRGPMPALVEFGRFEDCLRLDQTGEDGGTVRTEWFAPELGLIRWIDHWSDHDETYELVYYSCGRSGQEYGEWPDGLAAA